MANQALSMMKLRTLIRYKQEGRTHRFIGRSLGLSRTTVIKYTQFLEHSGLDWATLSSLDDQGLLMLCRSGQVDSPDDRWATLSHLLPRYVQELKRPHVTRQTLFEEYQKSCADGYGKTQFFKYLHEHLRLQQAYQPIEHKAGEKLFIDYAGDHLHLTDPDTGELIPVEVFVAALGCSGLIFAEASMGQTLPEFSQSIQHAFEYIGGVTACLVPDNLKSAVTRANKYEPHINERFLALAEHFGTAVVPARPRSPKDKPKVENAVLQVYRRIYAHLRDQTFHTLIDLNIAIRAELGKLNALPMQGRKESRQSLFEHIEREHLRPLPAQAFVWKQQRELTVQKNCHVQLSHTKHYYSVPFRHIGRKVKVLYDTQHVEVFYQNERVALHSYSYKPNGYSTQKDHMPSAHRFVSEWSAEYFIRRAQVVGPRTAELFQAMFRTKAHPEQAYRSCQGILALAQQQGHALVELACFEAIERRQFNYAFIHRQLHQKRPKSSTSKVLSIPDDHQNLRGSEYYALKNQGSVPA
jgi:transposase